MKTTKIGIMSYLSSGRSKGIQIWVPSMLLIYLLSATTVLGFHISWISRTTKAIKSVRPDTCQCQCCYEVGLLDQRECLPAEYTSFDVASCTDCNVTACARRFPISCAEPTSEVDTKCIVRKGWLIRLVPMIFILVSAGLLVYGIFFKKYDGYHPVSSPEAVRARARMGQHIATETETRIRQ